MIRALLDANVFVSYLLAPSGSKTPHHVVNAAFAGGFTLVFPSELRTELFRIVRDKPYLSARIGIDFLSEFVSSLAAFAELLAPLDSPIPTFGRDRKDDYLFAAAIVSEVDYIVSGDVHLLELVEVNGIPILRPVAFALLLLVSQDL